GAGRHRAVAAEQRPPGGHGLLRRPDPERLPGPRHARVPRPAERPADRGHRHVRPRELGQRLGRGGRGAGRGAALSPAGRPAPHACTREGWEARIGFLMTTYRTRRFTMRPARLALLALATLAVAIGWASANEELLELQQDASQFVMPNANYAGQNYSPLDQI